MSKKHRLPDKNPLITRHASHYLAASISLVTLAVYLPALRNGFVNLDDHIYVFNNLHIRSLNWAFFTWAFTDLSAGFWHPLTWISLAVDYALWGLNPLGYHLTAILLHAINTFLVVNLTVRLLDGVRGLRRESESVPFLDERGILITAGLTGLLFGLHPLHVESVAWISERKDLLCALFFLLSIIAYTEYVRTQCLTFPPAENLSSRKGPGQVGMIKSGRQSPRSYYMLSLGFFILALSAKTMAVTLPGVLLLMDWYPFRRIRSMKSFMAAAAEKAPFIASSLLISVVSVAAQKSIGALTLTGTIPLSARVLVAFKALVLYLWKIVMPIHLFPFYSYPKDISFLSPEYFSAIALVVGITAACILSIHRQRVFLSIWAYYVITLLPVLGIVQVGTHFMADRFSYLPSLGPFLIMGLCSAWVWAKVKAGKTVKHLTAAMALALGISLSFLTLSQIAIWKNSLDLWSYCIEKEPLRFPEAYFLRGLAFYEKGAFDRAMADFNVAITLKPDEYTPYNNRGNVFYRKGEFDRAIEDFSTAIALNPAKCQPYSNRGAVFARTGEHDRAMEDYAKALSMDPYCVDAYIGRGDLYMKKGVIDLAVKDYQMACDLGSTLGCNKALFPFEKR